MCEKENDCLVNSGLGKPMPLTLHAVYSSLNQADECLPSSPCGIVILTVQCLGEACVLWLLLNSPFSKFFLEEYVLLHPHVPKEKEQWEMQI